MHYKQKWTPTDKEVMKRMEEENKEVVVQATKDFVTNKEGNISKETNQKTEEKNKILNDSNKLLLYKNNTQNFSYN